MKLDEFNIVLRKIKAGDAIGVSGGKSIEAFLDAVQKNHTVRDNSRFIVIDERDVAETDEQSNYGKVRNLLGHSAEIYSTKELYEEQRAHLDLKLVVMGFGEDGHFASIFKNIGTEDVLHSGVAFKTKIPVGSPLCVRYSLSESTILSAENIILLINTLKKARLITNVLKDCKDSPLARLLDRRRDVGFINLLNNPMQF